MHYDEDNQLHPRESTQAAPSSPAIDRSDYVGRSWAPVIRQSQPVEDNGVLDKTCSPRRRISIASPGEETDSCRIKQRVKSFRRAASQAEESFGSATASAMLSLRKDKVEMRREEIKSKVQVSAAQTRTLDVGAKYVDAKENHEPQSSRLSLLKLK